MVRDNLQEKGIPIIWWGERVVLFSYYLDHPFVFYIFIYLCYILLLLYMCDFILLKYETLS